MESLFAIPMRQNNNNILNSELILLSDWMTVADVGGIHLRIDCISINLDAEIIVNYIMRNGDVEMGSGGVTFSEIGKHEIVFSRSDFDDTTTIQGNIQVVGRARFSVEILKSDKGEDLLEWL